MTGQQRTRGVNDVDHRDVALLPADRDAPVVRDLDRVAEYGSTVVFERYFALSRRRSQG